MKKLLSLLLVTLMIVALAVPAYAANDEIVINFPSIWVGTDSKAAYMSKLIDDFNAEVDEYEKYTEAYLMEFSEADEDEVCTRLFGVPSDWNYVDEPPKLLFQYDPLDNDMDFLDTLDGFVYFFFGEDEKDFEKITLWEEYTY